ncbi:sugar kinase [Streptomyces alkaliphilus]|uniref:sugar kinase n=1 Tax=Streptomyces alkaliphilus TaxID=1472722 RepID=UPI0012950422|nr:sugar kinase [Streptomyces alkaliphilus]
MLCVHTPGPLTAGAGARITVAGAESNVAVGLARLGHRAGWAGRLGADEPGRTVLRALRGEGVDLRHASADEGAPTGAMLRETRVGDIARVHYWRAGSAASRQRPDHLAAALADGARILHLTGITPALGEGPRAAVTDALRHAREHGWTVSLDVNHRERLWSGAQAASVLRSLLPGPDVVIASEDELPIVAGAAGDGERQRVAELFAEGVGEVVVKLGAQGARIHHRDGSTTEAPARRVPVRDTPGAGDAFCAGYLSGLLDGLGAGRRLERAVVCGAFAVACEGDWEGLAHRDELTLLDGAPGHTVR